MRLSERITHALIGAVLGAGVGLAGWWLYGLAHSLQHTSPMWDPVMRHWVYSCGALFAVLGALFGQAVMSMLADAVSAILSFELGDVQRHASGFYALVLLAIVLVAIWFTTPSLSGSAA